MIGRSAACKVVVDETQVSRRHARLSVSDDGVVLEDLDSANGVFVDGERIDRRRLLASGGRFLIGSHEFRIVAEERADGTRRRPVSAPPVAAPPRPSALDSLWDDDDLGAEYGARTKVDNYFELVRPLLNEMLAKGQADEAEHLLAAQLQLVLDQARAGRDLADRLEPAARWALELARAGGKGRWLQYVFQLYLAAQRAMPSGVVDELEGTLDSVTAVELACLHEYVGALRAREGALDVGDRIALKRVAKLVRRAASR